MKIHSAGTTTTLSAIGDRLWLLALVFAISSLTGCRGERAAPVTIAIVNARVWSGDSTAPWAEAVAISGARIAAVGTTAQIRALVADSTRVIDAAGAMVTPGFIDSHVHFLDGGLALASVQLRDAKTKAEFI